MGHMVSRLKECSSVVDIITRRGRKRKRSSSDESLNESSSTDVGTPKRKKLQTTTQYIYQALFEDEKSSDITVLALGKTWHLHKVYLCQSPYFDSMFNGSWKESCESFIHIQIYDSRITLDALHAVFGSLYSDEIEIDSKNVISVLATATLFQMDGIINKCAESMIETIHAETAVTYYEAACQYGAASVKRAAYEWLETNLLGVYSKQPKYLKSISTELMTKLVSSPDLYVMQTEFSLYTLLRTWMFMKLHPDYDPENQVKPTHDQPDAIFTFFAERTGKKAFLHTSEGTPFVGTFMALRTQYLVNHHMDLKLVLSDNIIPKTWVFEYVIRNWNSILKIDHTQELGPQNLDKDVFLLNCMRCGRILNEPGYHKWRWTGFNFGLDLVIINDSRVLNIRRHHRAEHERLLSLQTKRQFMIRVSVSAINSKRQRTFTQQTDILSLNLEKNEEVSLMVMDPKLVHPLLISVNVLVVDPARVAFPQNVESRAEANQVPISEIGAVADTSFSGGGPSNMPHSSSAPSISPAAAGSSSSGSEASFSSSQSVMSYVAFPV